MGRINFANQINPSTPSAGTTDIFVNSFDKNLYTLDDAGKLLMVDSAITAAIANITLAAAGTVVAVGGATFPAGANTIPIGASYRITIEGTFTGTVTATTFRVHLGTAGTAADAIIATGAVTGAVGTAIARIEILVTFRTVGAAGTLQAFLNVLQPGVVGVSNLANNLVAMTTTTAPNTTVNNLLTVSVVSAAAGSSGTINLATIERI